jgi:hypothetical protein
VRPIFRIVEGKLKPIKHEELPLEERVAMLEQKLEYVIDAILNYSGEGTLGDALQNALQTGRVELMDEEDRESLRKFLAKNEGKAT